ESTPRYSADGVRMMVITISEDYAKRIAEMKNGSAMGMPNCYEFKIGGAPPPVKFKTSELIKNGTLLHVAGILKRVCFLQDL
ncbi:MAG: hypothetical protein ACNYVW_06385, partial [Methanosarcinales archaeon]